MEGKFSVDVAEIIKIPLTIYLMGLATEAGIHQTKVFNTKDGMPPRKEMLDDLTLLSIMKDRNPQMADMVLGGMQRQIVEEAQQQQEMLEGSFLGSPDLPQDTPAPSPKSFLDQETAS